MMGAFKIFGAALDAADDPWTLRLKYAAMHARENGADITDSDPYTALLPMLQDRPNLMHGGRFDIPDWLLPIPSPAARQQVTQDRMTRFVAAGGILELAGRLKSFVQDTIFPERPLMLGVDHALTGGVVSALAQRYGRNNLSLIILDQHFDGLPLSLRIDTPMLPTGQPRLDTGPAVGDDAYCCGNFIKHLIDAGTILPEKLLFIGVADYPGGPTPPGGTRFKETYLAFERLGCRFFPAELCKEDNGQALDQFIVEKITTPYLYVSLDMDVGAHRCTHAARYMDAVGIDREALLRIAYAISAGCRQDRFHLVGMDAMEFNMHFLGLELDTGHHDATLSIAHEFIKAMIDTC